MPLPNVPANLVPAGEAALVRRIEDIERAQRETLPAIMAAISPMFDDINQALSDAQYAIAQVQAQQDALEAQQAALADQVARIDALVSSQVTADGSNATTTTGITTSYADYASVVLSVPSGYSRAYVIGITAISTPASQLDTVSTVISGSVGPEIPAFGTAATAAYSRPISGLSGGSITIAARARNASGSNTGVRVLTTSALAVFLR
jgi:hypothetical protein